MDETEEARKNSKDYVKPETKTDNSIEIMYFTKIIKLGYSWRTISRPQIAALWQNTLPHRTC